MYIFFSDPDSFPPRLLLLLPAKERDEDPPEGLHAAHAAGTTNVTNDFYIFFLC